jgi:glucokinase
MEAYAGSAALLRKFKEAGGSASNVRQIAESPGPAADAVWQMMGQALGTGLATINSTLDLDAIVFAGGVSNSFQLVEPHIRQAMKSRAFAPPLANLPLLVTQLGDHAGVIGAAHLPFAGD